MGGFHRVSNITLELKTRNKVLDLNILDSITNELTLTTESQMNIS